MIFRSRILSFGLLTLALGPLASAMAADGDETEQAGVRVFEPLYYVEFDPVSALEMVFRTPGFNPQEQEGGRGLSGVRSNVLINGERPPPKGRSIRQQLRDMPIDAVVRIELIDAGARLDIDMQGYPQVVNVITVPNKPAYYEVVTQLQRTGTGDIDQENDDSTEVQANGSFSWKGHEFTMRGNYRDRGFQSPADIVSIDPANPVQRLSTVNKSTQDNNGIQIGADFVLPEKSALSVTARYSTFEFGRTPLISSITDPSLSTVSQSGGNENSDQDWSAEYRRPFGGVGSNLMIAVVDTRRDELSRSTLVNQGVTRASLRSGESGESAARLLVTQAFSEQLTLRTEVTTAFNFFDGGFRLFENGVELPITGSSNRVEEDRHTIKGSVDWNLTSRWTMQGSVGVESYDIRSTDVSSGTRTDPTGNFAVSFRPQPRTTFSFESARDIGQLSFNQFLASSNLSSEILTAGASELEPQRRWTHTAKYDRRFSDVGVMRFELSRQVIDNPVRSVALTDSLIVAQNARPETLDRLQASVELPFERFGREDLVLEVSGMLASSDAFDPITGESRSVSGYTRRQWRTQLRRDPGEAELSWGASIGGSTTALNYSVRETDLSTIGNEWNAYVLWEPINGLRMRMEVQGPHWMETYSNYFGSVRSPGLDPTFVSNTLIEIDRSANFIIEWRRQEHFEIRGSIGTQPRIRTVETLAPFGDPLASQLLVNFAEAPRATVRFRVYK